MTRTRLAAAGLAGLLLAAALPAATALAATTCLGLEPTIVGTSGPDTLTGTAGPDVIAGLGGDDVIRARGGDDIVCGGGGDDFITGGWGDDTLLGGSGDDEVRGNDGDDLIKGWIGADRLEGGEGADRIRGGPDDDVVLGGNGDDTLFGDDGADELHGERHADRLDGGPGDDVIWEFRAVDSHLAAGTPEASGDRFVYERIRAIPRTGWMLWQPMAGQLEQGHEGVLTVTNRADGLLMIERIDPERYLLGIAEMPYSWEPAALQSQAIAARTYLASLVSNPPYGPQAEYGFDICDHAACQVYKGTKYGWLEPWEDAVLATDGQVLLYNGAPAATFYHSTSGPTTRNIEDVWTSASPVPYLKAVEVPEQNSLLSRWWYHLPLADFMDVLARDGIAPPGTVEVIKTIKTDPGEGPYRLKIRTSSVTREYEITDIQRALNRHALAHHGEHIPSIHHVLGQAALSPTFVARLRDDGDVRVLGWGWGHQIGLSQYGAQAMAVAGSTAAEILSHFYTGLAPEPDPGLIPDLVDVGLFYENGSHPIVLRPTGKYTVRGPGGVIASGEGGTISITRYGDDAIAVDITP